MTPCLSGALAAEAPTKPCIGVRACQRRNGPLKSAVSCWEMQLPKWPLPKY